MIRPSRAGASLGIGAVTLIVAGRLLGLLEFYLLGAMVGLALLIAALYVVVKRLNVSVHRFATPGRPRVGTPTRIDLGISNRSRWSTPVLSVHDPVAEHRGTSVMMAPIGPDETASMAYRLPTTTRGPVSVGPLHLTVTDPLGLFRSNTKAADRLEVLVLPVLLPLSASEASAGRETDPEALAHRTVTNSGEEFFALRPYVVGDDLRRVDWRASARVDDLVVRQEEQPRSGRLTLILDHHSSVFSSTGKQSVNQTAQDAADPAFERAISVAASMLQASYRAGEPLRFLSGKATADTVRSRNDLQAAEDHLARLTPGATTPLPAVIDDICRSKPGGGLVVITGKITAEAAAALSRANQVHSQVIAVSCIDGVDASTPDRFPVPTVIYARDTDFVSQWRATLARTARRARLS